MKPHRAYNRAKTAETCLNHLLVFVDELTYLQIASCDFLNKVFAPSEQRSTIDAANNASWTGCYFYGASTYFEFMDPAATTWRPVDGIALGVDESGDGDVVYDYLREAFPESATRYVREREYQGDRVPWFEMIESGREGDESLVTWIMAYHPQFLARWDPLLPPKAGGISRCDVLSRYRSRAAREELSGGLFKDIETVTVGVRGHEANSLRRELRSLNLQLSDTESGFEAVSTGIHLAVEIDPDHGKTGIREFTISLSGTTGAPEILRYGDNTSLSITSDNTAVWQFS